MSKLSHPSVQKLQRLAGQLGVPGFIGLLLVAASGLAMLVWLPQQRAETEQQQEQIEHLRSQLKAAAAVRHDAKAPAPAVADQARAGWQTLWAALPGKEQADHLQVELIEAARVRGVQTLSVAFKGEALKGLPLVWRQQINLPIEAPYPALRAWLAQVQAQPAVSIDALEVSRADVMSDQVKGRVALSVWRRRVAGEILLGQQGGQP